MSQTKLVEYNRLTARHMWNRQGGGNRTVIKILNSLKGGWENTYNKMLNVKSREKTACTAKYECSILTENKTGLKHTKNFNGGYL